jgi:hypothetical protein
MHLYHRTRSLYYRATLLGVPIVDVWIAMRTMLFVVVHRKQRCRTFFFIVPNAQSSTVLNLASFDVECPKFGKTTMFFRQIETNHSRDPS